MYILMGEKRRRGILYFCYLSNEIKLSDDILLVNFNIMYIMVWHDLSKLLLLFMSTFFFTFMYASCLPTNYVWFVHRCRCPYNTL